MLRSRSFLLRPSRSSSKAISMPPSFPSTQNESLNRNENANIFNKNNGAATNENKRRISYPLNRSNTNNTRYLLRFELICLVVNFLNPEYNLCLNIQCSPFQHNKRRPGYGKSLLKFWRIQNPNQNRKQK